MQLNKFCNLFVVWNVLLHVKSTMNRVLYYYMEYWQQQEIAFAILCTIILYYYFTHLSLSKVQLNLQVVKAHILES